MTSESKHRQCQTHKYNKKFIIYLYSFLGKYFARSCQTTWQYMATTNTLTESTTPYTIKITVQQSVQQSQHWAISFERRVSSIGYWSYIIQLIN